MAMFKGLVINVTHKRDPYYYDPMFRGFYKVLDGNRLVASGSTYGCFDHPSTAEIGARRKAEKVAPQQLTLS